MKDCLEEIIKSKRDQWKKVKERPKEIDIHDLLDGR